MELSQFLENYGFTQRQSKVYLAALELGNAPASSIARFCGENRLTTYSVLKELMKKGFINELEKNKIKFYTANSPEKLLDEQRHKLEAIEKKMPEFMAIVNTFTNRPRVQFFEGVDGVKKIYEHVLESKDTIHAFVEVGHIEEELAKDLFETVVLARAKKKLLAKVIVNDTPANRIYKNRDKELYKETLLIKDPVFNLECEVDLYDEDKVAVMLFSIEEMSGLVIHSKMLYNTLLGIFNLIWNTHKK